MKLGKGTNKAVVGLLCGITIGSVGTSVFLKADDRESTSEYTQGQGDNNGDRNNNVTSDNRGGKRPPSGGHHRGEADTSNVDSVSLSDGTYKDGTYTGSSVGYAPGMEVSVTISSNKITDIKITNHNETPGFYEQAFQVVPAEIIQSQSTKVDTVSGATYSSIGIINGVNKALEQAKS